MLFPEGCTHNGESLIRFKTGAFAPRHPVQPVVIRYPHCAFHPGWTTASLVGVLFRMLCQVYNRVQIEVLEPIEPQPKDGDGDDKKDAEEYAKRVMEFMSAQSGIGIVGCDRTLQQPYLDLHGDETPLWRFALCGAGQGDAKVSPA